MLLLLLESWVFYNINSSGYPGLVPWRETGWKQFNSPNTMRRVCVSVEPSGFWAVQRNMEPLSSAGTLSRISSLPTNSWLPSSRRPPTLDQVNMGSGNTSVCGHTNTETLFSERSSPGVAGGNFMEPTVEGPNWKPWTVMCTVSSTLAWLGVMDNLGPLGAAEKRSKWEVVALS